MGGEIPYLFPFSELSLEKIRGFLFPGSAWIGSGGVEIGSSGAVNGPDLWWVQFLNAPRARGGIIRIVL